MVHNFNKWKTLIATGNYEAYRNAIIIHQAQLAFNNRTEDSNYWKEMGKEIHEPALQKLILAPLGMESKLVLGYYEDLLINGEPYDYKFDTAAFMKRNPTYTHSIDYEDLRKYDDNMKFLLHHVRIPGIEYAWTNDKGKLITEFYTGTALDVICIATVAEVKRIRKERGLKPQPYKKRENEAPQSGNESHRYEFDIRWFPLTYRYQGGGFEPSSWTQEELGPSQLEEEEAFAANA